MVVPPFIAFGFRIAMAVSGAAVALHPDLESKPERDNGAYLVLSLVDAGDDFHIAAERLARRHSAEIIYATPATIGETLPELQTRQPQQMAIVVRPEDLDFNLAQEIFVLGTRIDPDPFLDVAYGYITGRDAEAALRLVEASAAREVVSQPSISLFGVGGAPQQKSIAAPSIWMLRNGRVAVQTFHAVGDSDAARDHVFIAETMPKLSGAPILLLASHGYPDGLVGGPKAADLRGVDLAGSVVLNIACYNGVTRNWFEDDWAAQVVRLRSADPGDSFCLQVIDCGAAAYVAYLGPRPAGPTMMGDALRVASSGESMGVLYRESGQSVVLAHLLGGDDAVTAAPAQDGAALDPQRTPAAIVKQMSLGGALFGDPAYRPFSARPDSDPRQFAVDDQEDTWTVEMKITTPLFHFFAADQINYWDDRHAAMRLEATIPLGNRGVRSVRVATPPAGVERYRWVAAVESDDGQRFLRLKLNFAQPEDHRILQQWSMRGLHAQWEVETEVPFRPDEFPILRGTSD